MNKKQEIAYKMDLFKKGYSTKVLGKLAEFEKRKEEIKDMETPPEGAKVKLNYERISTYPDYVKDKENCPDTHRKSYIDFIENNKETIFTVEYDIRLMERHKNLVCFVEDERESKWAWWIGDLIVLKSEETQ